MTSLLFHVVVKGYPANDMNRVSALRGICRLVSTTRVRPGVAALPRWTHTASVYHNRQWLNYENTNTARLRPQWRKAEMLLFRQYSEDTAMSQSELQDGVINVLKLFDKIDPDKVSTIFFNLNCRINHAC